MARAKKTPGTEIRITLGEHDARRLRFRDPDTVEYYANRAQGLARASGKVVIYTDDRGRVLATATP